MRRIPKAKGMVGWAFQRKGVGEEPQKLPNPSSPSHLLPWGAKAAILELGLLLLGILFLWQREKQVAFIRSRNMETSIESVREVSAKGGGLNM